MRKTTVVLLVVLTACGASAGAGTGGAGVTNAGAAKPGGLTVQEALETDATGPLLVTGSYVHAEGEPPRLCAAMLESYPRSAASRRLWSRASTSRT